MNKRLEQILDKVYPPRERINRKFGNAEITFITDHHGEPVTLYIGSRKEDGEISGERYVRKVKMERGERKIHWENKGKV